MRQQTTARPPAKLISKDATTTAAQTSRDTSAQPSGLGNGWHGAGGLKGRDTGLTQHYKHEVWYRAVGGCGNQIQRAEWSMKKEIIFDAEELVAPVEMLAAHSQGKSSYISRLARSMQPIASSSNVPRRTAGLTFPGERPVIDG